MNKDLTIAIIAGTLLLMMLISFIITFFTINQRKKEKLKLEQVKLARDYEEQLLKSRLEMQEHTFNTISSEIHDNVGQVLSLAKVQLNIIDQKDTLDKVLLADAKESVSKAMTDLRDIAKSLNSKRIQQSGLFEITEYELDRISRVGLMTTSIQANGLAHTIAEQKKLIIFRIIQESLQNIIKHSKATNIDACFTYHDDALQISIADNGSGFDTALLQRKDGLGLQNIFNRVGLIGGTATINSILGSGTTITITSPYA